MKYLVFFTIFMYHSISYGQYDFQELSDPTSRYFGSKISQTPDGQNLAVGMSRNNTNSRVRIYKLSGTQYIYKSFIDFTFELSDVIFSDDGKRLLISTGSKNIFRESKSFVYEQGLEGWEQVGNSIVSDSFNTIAGSGIDFSADGNIHVTCDPDFDNQSGIVEVYSFNDTIWQLKGDAIIGDNGYRLGSHASLSGDGNTLSVAYRGSEIGIQVYNFNNGIWNTLGNPIYTHYGKHELSRSGDRLFCGNSSNGKIGVYHLVNNQWELMGPMLTPHNAWSNSWNTINIDVTSDGNHFIMSFLNNSSQKTKIAIFDYVDGLWIERRKPNLDEIKDDYYGVNSQITDNPQMIILSDMRYQGKGRVRCLIDVRDYYAYVDAFYDKNENGIKDENDPIFADCLYEVDSLYKIAPNENGGAFISSIFGGAHNVSILLDTLLKTVGDSIYELDDDYNNIDSFRFAITHRHEYYKIEGQSHGDDYLCDREANVKFDIKNISSEPIYLTVKLAFDSLETSNSYPENVISSNTQLFWTSDTLSLFENRSFSSNFMMPPASSLGDTIKIVATVLAYNIDSGTLVDSITIDRSAILRCSYDPNDKQVFPIGIGEDNLTLINQNLNYKIRFQNTGNYPAENIIIEDQLSSNLDISTFRIIGSSHPLYGTEINNGQIRFIFNNINLPDSVNNEPESHGYVEYIIRPYSDLKDNTLIQNTAYIFFDFNDPIVTNTTSSMMVSSLPKISSTKENILINEGLYFYPNPVEDILILPDFEKFDQIDIYNIIGRKVLSINPTSAEIVTSSLLSGNVYTILGYKKGNIYVAKFLKY